jgi:Domain of unknown function (DUF5666)
MLAKLTALLHSKIGLAIIGATFVAGTGAVVATATGATSHLPLASFAQNGAHARGDDDATKTPGGVGEHQERHGVVASVNHAGSSFVLTVTHGDDGDQDDTGGEHGTPTTTSTSKSTPTTSTLTVKVIADTKFEGVTKTFADLKAGMGAEVGGDPQSDGGFLAAKVEASNGNDDNDVDANHQQTDVSGAVATVGAASFTIKDEKGAIATVTVSSTTTFEGVKGIAELKAGMRVQVKGVKQSNGSIAAQRVQVEGSGHEGD